MRNKRSIEDHFDKSIELEAVLQEKGAQELLRIVQNVSSLVNLHFIRQKQLLGLGHAVLTARKFIGDEPFALLLGDEIIDIEPPCLKQMINLYNEVKTSIIALQQVPWEEVHKYGIISSSEKNGIQYIDDLVEKPDRDRAPTNMAVIGRYIIEPQLFSILENCQFELGSELQLTDVLRILNLKHQMAVFQNNGKRYDVGDKLVYIVASIEYALQRKELKPKLREYLIGLVKNWHIRE